MLKPLLKLMIIGILLSVGKGAFALCVATRFVSGDWSNATDWQRGATCSSLNPNDNGVPASGDTVLVQAGHQMRVDGPGAVCASLTVQGTLTFHRSVSSDLTLTAGDLQVVNTGVLDMGSEADPIPAGVTATLVLAPGTPSTVRKLLVDFGGRFTSFGAPKDRVALAQQDLNLGDTSLSVPRADIDGWAPGDRITIGQTERAIPWEPQTETRVIQTISAGDPTTVSWVGGPTPEGLDFPHDASVGIRVCNLTRNVVIRSSGTNLSSNSARVEFQHVAPTGVFHAVNTEFYSLGRLTPSLSQLGLYGGNGAGTIVLSSSTIHGGGNAINLDEGTLTEISDCVIFQAPNVAGGHLAGTFQRAYFLRNDWIGGTFLSPQTEAVFIDNAVYSKDSGIDGFTLDSAVVERNKIFCNDGFGFGGNLTQSTSLSQNEIFRNSYLGIHLLQTNDLVAEGNDIWENGDDGIYLSGSSPENTRTLLAGNLIHGNLASSIAMISPCPGLMILSPRSWGNAGGIYVRNTGPITIQDGVLGYNLSGQAAYDGSNLLTMDDRGAISRLRMNGTVSNYAYLFLFTEQNTSVLAQNLNFATGTVRVMGREVLGPGESLRLDNAQPLYNSAATAVKLLRGTGHVLTVNGTNDDNAVSQAVIVRYNGGQWTIRGTQTGLFGTLPQGGGVFSGSQFTLTLSPQGVPQEYDQLAFGLLSSSWDAGRTKSLTLEDLDGAPGSLSLEAGSSLLARGTEGGPRATVGRYDSGDLFYGLSSSGTVTLENVNVNDMGAAGLRSMGGASLALSSVTFNGMGAAAGAYLTAAGLTSNATFYNVIFEDSRSQSPLNVRVTGTDSNLRWYFASFGGTMSGENNDLDPNQRIYWADTRGPDAPGSFAAAPGTTEGEIVLNWTAPWDRESAPVDNSTSPLERGSYAIFRSTSVTATNAATPADAQITGSTTVAQGTPCSYRDTVPQVGTVYYYKLWILDEFGNPSTPGTDNDQAYRVTPWPVANFTATATSSDTITLSWTAPSAPPPAYVGGYRIERSTVSGTGPYVFVSSAAGSAVDHVDPGLPLETMCYYQVVTYDNGPVPWESTPAQASERTAEVSRPGASIALTGGRILGVPRDAVATITFTKAMDTAPTEAAVNWRFVKDRLGVSTDAVVTPSLAWDPGNQVLTATPPPLEGNGTYEIALASSAADAFGKTLASSETVRFTTLMDRTVQNVATEGTGGARVDIPAGTLPEDGYVVGTERSPSEVSAATAKLAAVTGDDVRSPLQGALVRLEAFDAAGNPQTAPGASFRVFLPYADSDGDGVIDGTNPPARAKTLAVYRLDETNNVWVRLPSADSSGWISAPLNRSSTLALMAQADTDLSAAYAFPSPYRASAGGGVTFTGLSQTGRIRIYTTEGALVREKNLSGGDGGQWVWDVKNADGEPVASGLYLYEVENDQESKAGKLAVLR